MKPIRVNGIKIAISSTLKKAIKEKGGSVDKTIKELELAIKKATRK